MRASEFIVRLAEPADLDGVKRLFDANRTELGFVLRPSLASAIGAKECIVATANDDVIGCVHYHHRRDGQTTLYHIAVASEHRQQDIGVDLVAELKTRCAAAGSNRIFLKCPVELAANQFYLRVGFDHIGAETGRRRALNHWMLKVMDRVDDAAG